MRSIGSDTDHLNVIQQIHDDEKNNECSNGHIPTGLYYNKDPPPTPRYLFHMHSPIVLAVVAPSLTFARCQ